MQIAGKGLGDVKGELEKIILFVGDAKRINISDVESAGIDVKEESVFALDRRHRRQRTRQARLRYTQSSRRAPLMLLGSIARQMRIIMKIKEL